MNLWVYECFEIHLENAIAVGSKSLIPKIIQETRILSPQSDSERSDHYRKSMNYVRLFRAAVGRHWEEKYYQTQMLIPHMVSSTVDTLAVLMSKKTTSMGVEC